MKVLIVGGIAQSLVNFRGELIKEMIKNGCTVITCSGYSDHKYTQKLELLGARYIPLNLSRANTGIIKELRLFLELIRIIKSTRPDTILTYTIKPVIWGGLAAKMAGMKEIYGMVEGLGRVFMPVESLKHGISSGIAKFFYKLSLKFYKKVFFLNPDDKKLFIENAFVEEKQVGLINGIGVDLNYYHKKKQYDGHFCFLMIARLLKDKGVYEYLEAAKKLKKKFPFVIFRLLGVIDENPSSIQFRELRRWTESNVIEYIEEVDDIRPFVDNCSAYVLPSYREGLPRTVMEAMAMEKTVITTDVPGCRETVLLTEKGKESRLRGEHVMEGYNGFLVSVRNSDALSLAMKKLVENPQLAEKMGEQSLRIARKKFDVRRINKEILSTITAGMG